MQSSRSKTRPLGSVRHSLTGLDRTPQLPRLPMNTDSMLDKNYRGIQGSAMYVPPSVVKDTPTPSSHDYLEERRKSSSKSNQSENRNNKSPDMISKKELKEALGREKDLKQQISDLLKQIQDLKGQLGEKEKLIVELQTYIVTQEKDFQSQLTKELKNHEDTKVKLTLSDELIEKLKKEMKELKQVHEIKIDNLKKEHEERLQKVIEEKDKEINVREEKLKKLKQHMAEALQGNSWERQQQLEELTKELAKIQEEADMLRAKIKSLTKNKPGSCAHCEETNTKLKKVIQAVKEKDQTIYDLKSLVVKFEKQLSQQDQLLKLWADEKGHNIKLPK